MRRRKLWLGLCALVSGGVLLAQPNEGLLTGRVLDPDGRPVRGFRLIFRAADVTPPREYTSEPTDKLGRYAIRIPAPGTYALVGALAPDGTRVDVPALPPFSVEAGVRRLDIRFHVPEEVARSRRWRELPWWRIGTAVGAVLVLWEGAMDGGTPERPASPF